MKILYGSSGSWEIINQGLIPDNKFENAKEIAIKLFSLRGHETARMILCKHPYFHYMGTNSFGDEFSYLQADLQISEYEKLLTESENSEWKYAYRIIVDTLNEAGLSLRFICADVRNENNEQIEMKQIENPSDTMRACLISAENEIRLSNHIGALDRLHTAFHGYLLYRLNKKSQSNESITKLFKEFKSEIDNNEVSRIFTSCSGIIDAINVIRNHHSLSHPNEELIKNEDAEFVVNIIKVVFNYMEAKRRMSNS